MKKSKDMILDTAFSAAKQYEMKNGWVSPMYVVRDF